MNSDDEARPDNDKGMEEDVPMASPRDEPVGIDFSKEYFTKDEMLRLKEALQKGKQAETPVRQQQKSISSQVSPKGHQEQAAARKTAASTQAAPKTSPEVVVPKGSTGKAKAKAPAPTTQDVPMESDAEGEEAAEETAKRVTRSSVQVSAPEEPKEGTPSKRGRGRPKGVKKKKSGAK
ncbi:MAG: hypothetical protein L6R39_007856 [Caloplaca ligustica]|nr:MAG: hypothetical protein L6R39_007856 [Caloplaca ligustica]